MEPFKLSMLFDSFRGHSVRSWFALRRHFLLDCDYVGLIEVVRSGESFALLRSPTFRWFWMARSWVAIVSWFERGAERLVRRIVSAHKADLLEEGYQEWASAGMEQPKFSKKLAAWAAQQGEDKRES